ncbi:MAG: DUF2585 family protein [Planctomycetota bacterium]|nr:DUF2585 family protein [Planctomycetota bacterium]
MAIAAMTVGLRLEGRIWWCACGSLDLWKSDVWSSHCSQHLVDPYSITHLSHGLLIWCGLAMVLDMRWTRGAASSLDGARQRSASMFATPWRITAAVVFACVWELAENSPAVIERYRSVTMSLDYLGDSVINSLGDVACCTVGMFVARRLGVLRTLAFFAVTEIALLWLIRDNLTLNVIMLAAPIDAIKQWQMQGHGVPITP